MLLRAFGETGYKVSYTDLLSTRSILNWDISSQSEFAIPPAYHGNDLPYYFSV
jgi:hypothetical protein